MSKALSVSILHEVKHQDNHHHEDGYEICLSKYERVSERHISSLPSLQGKIVIPLERLKAETNTNKKPVTTSG